MRPHCKTNLNTHSTKMKCSVKDFFGKCDPIRSSLPFNTWCPLKGHTYLNELLAESLRFVLVCMAFNWTLDVKFLDNLR